MRPSRPFTGLHAGLESRRFWFEVLAAGREFGRWAENPPGVHRTADDKLAAAKIQSRKLTKSG